MSIDQPRVIDFISTRPNENSCVVCISDHLEWNDGAHLLALQEKLNNYLAFIESGEIYDSYPDAKDKEIEISIHCKYTPQETDDIKFLQFAKNTIEGADFKFSVLLESGEFQVPNDNQ